MKTMRDMGGPMMMRGKKGGGMMMGGKKGHLTEGDMMKRQEMMEKRMDHDADDDGEHDAA